MKTAILVIGPESSGTKLWTQILIAAGCDGDAGDHQRWDTIDPESNLVVWRRSMPHDGWWPNVAGLVERLRGLDYDVSAIVTTRSWHAMAHSQAMHGHTESVVHGLHNLQLAYPRIFSGLSAARAPFVMAHYENLVARPHAAMEQLLSPLGLEVPDIDIYDGNEKWYGEASGIHSPMARNIASMIQESNAGPR